MSLLPGARVGAHEITGQIGAGGMGEVYRATDSNLKRSVAIKVLPASVAGDLDRLARFQREAEVLAALNHPNIAAIHGLEKTADLTALVMELVDGEDLSTLIASGTGNREPGTGLPIHEALAIARQIAEALEAAHEQGIVHRDLKPANIKVRPDGTVKVLDFGLAKAIEPASASSANVANSPTLSIHATQAGMILGTAAYMAPEQARGKVVDKRADIWAFGVVLHEMLTGRRLFDAEDISETLAAVLTRDVSLASLPADTPARLRALLRDCLVRDPKQRLRDIGDARLVLDKIIAGVPDDAVAPVGVNVAIAPAWRRRLPWALAAVAGAALAAVLFMWAPWRATPDVSNPVRHVVIPIPQTLDFAEGALRHFALSPDGSRLVYRAREDGGAQLYVRALDANTVTSIAHTEDARQPTFSPDSRWIVFRPGPGVVKIPAEGGLPTVLDRKPGQNGITWTTDDHILFVSPGAAGIGLGGGLWSVPPPEDQPHSSRTRMAPRVNGRSSHRRRCRTAVCCSSSIEAIPPTSPCCRKGVARRES